MHQPRYLSVILLILFATFVRTQQPKTDFPALNPNNAKLVQTSSDLDGPGLGIAFSADKNVLLVACESGQVRSWTREEGKDVLTADSKSTVLKGHTKPVTAVAIAGSLAATASTDGTILVWNLPGNAPAKTIKAGTTVRALALSADGKTLASGGDDNNVQLWDPATGKAGKKLTGAKDWILAVAFSNDGKTVLAGGHDGRLWAWDADSGNKKWDVVAGAPVKPVKGMEPDPNVVSAVAFSPDGKQIVAGGSDGKVYQFGPDGKYVRTLTGHTSGITGLAYHPGGTTLASSSKDRALRLWNMQNGSQLKTLEGHTAWAQGVIFVDKGTKLLSTGADKSVRLWDLGSIPPKKK